MILIITDNNDGSTSDVIKWIKFYKKEFIRINENTIVTIDKIVINKLWEIVLSIGNQSIALSKISSVWYRRGRICFFEEIDINIDGNKDLYFSAMKEMKVARDFIYALSKTKKSINNAHNGSINKLFALYMAAESGLSIPNTLITSKKKELLEFKKANVNIITKPMFEMPLIKSMPFFSIYTSKVSTKCIENLSHSFFMSKFQENLNKDYELRIFFLHGKTYTMAIFSQRDAQTSIDFRRYKGNKPNRKTPYKLPRDIEDKIINFMNKVELNCGSIDMVVTKEREYVFLEVNPVGQFNMVSYPCNYNLEKEIANYL